MLVGLIRKCLDRKVRCIVKVLRNILIVVVIAGSVNEAFGEHISSSYTFFTQGKNVTEINTQFPAQKGLIRRGSEDEGIKQTGNYQVEVRHPKNYQEVCVEITKRGDRLEILTLDKPRRENLDARTPVYQQLYHEDSANTHIYLIFPKDVLIIKELQRIGCFDENGRIKGGMFSYTRQTLVNPPLLPGNWDVKGFDLRTTGMWDSNKKKIVFVNGCLSAKYVDLAEAFGILSLPNYSSKDMVYIGWRQAIFLDTGILNSITKTTTDGVALFWDQLGQGRNVWQAMDSINYASWGIRLALLGPNAWTNLGNPDPPSGDDWLYLWYMPGTNLKGIFLLGDPSDPNTPL